MNRSSYRSYEEPARNDHSLRGAFAGIIIILTVTLGPSAIAALIHLF